MGLGGGCPPLKAQGLAAPLPDSVPRHPGRRGAGRCLLDSSTSLHPNTAFVPRSSHPCCLQQHLVFAGCLFHRCPLSPLPSPPLLLLSCQASIRHPSPLPPVSANRLSRLAFLPSPPHRPPAATTLHQDCLSPSVLPERVLQPACSTVAWWGYTPPLPRGR